MKVSELSQLEEFNFINKANVDKEIDGCYTSDLLSWVMGHAKISQCWITIMSHINIVAIASLLDLSCIIIAEGEMPDKNTIQKAVENDITLITTDLPTFDAAKILIAKGFV